MLFSFQIKKDADIQVVYFEGELIERSQATELMAAVQALLENKELKYIFDLNDLRYMNSSGLNVLINLLTKARKEGGEVIITHVNKKIRELLIITKLTSMFAVTDSIEQAVSRFK
ncbi:MAG: anti-anti-sigma factor [Bacteroidetes bacterium]|jgi:anti-sigma B factor antagonist|nr:anti-anti-sigma factor [Bacteroidota bacterium]